MSEKERKVWAAIEDALHAVGDADIRAGLAWINDEGKQKVAQAAIEAMK